MRDLLASLRALVTSLTARIDYYALYPATVVSQGADGSVDVKVDSPKLANAIAGSSGLKIRNGIPGLKVVVPKGIRVRVGFEGGDPSMPYASLWDSGSIPGVQLYLAADAWAIRGGPAGGPQSFVGVDENGVASLTTAMGSLIAVDPKTGIVQLLACDPNNLDDNGNAQWAGTIQLGPAGFSGTFAGGVCGFKWDAVTGEFTSTGQGSCSLAHASGQLGPLGTAVNGIAYSVAGPANVISSGWTVTP